ncbi:MAG: hypothetical protein ICV54_11825 [Nostoc sp. C3-bin3]|nr:hypothetical protein [Nostoc sp. C3-bin3]
MKRIRKASRREAACRSSKSTDSSRPFTLVPAGIKTFLFLSIDNIVRPKLHQSLCSQRFNLIQSLCNLYTVVHSSRIQVVVIYTYNEIPEGDRD